MSLTQPTGGGYGGPPPGYPYPPREGHEPARPPPPPPTLPSMSSLLNHEPQQQEPRNNQYTARQFQPPYNMTKQMQHPLFLSQQDPDAPVQHIYRPPPHGGSTQGPPEPMLVPLQQPPPQPRVQKKTVPSPSRQNRAVTQRRADEAKGADEDASRSEYRSEFHSDYPRRPSEQNPSPTNLSFVHSPLSYSRRESTMSESSQPTNSKMPISGLLSDGPNPVQRPPRTYTLKMRQQPVAARACGFGERDRRVIDPPPILQMNVEGPNLTPTEISTLIRSPFSVIHCTLWDPDTDTDATAMPGTTDKRQQRRLMGTLVASPFVGKDEHGVEGCFFTFPDLSVRTPGKYSLKFALVNLDPHNMRPGTSEPITSRIWSGAFQVFNAKDFGGMRASTALTKTLKHQGCLISVKKGNNKSGGPGREDDDDDDDDDDGEDNAESSKRGKRVKR